MVSKNSRDTEVYVSLPVKMNNNQKINMNADVSKSENSEIISLKYQIGF